MKLIRTKTPATYGDRKKETATIAIVVRDFKWQEKLNRYEVVVEDCKVVDTGATETGHPLKSYQPIGTKTVHRTTQQVNDLFNYFAVDIVQGDDFTLKFRDLIVKSLLLDTQQNPIYGTTASDWEIIETDTEVA